MKRIIAYIIVCFLLNTIQAQKTEISIGLNGNFSFFRGPDSKANTFFSFKDTITFYRYGNFQDYSKVLRLGAGVEGLVQIVFKDNFIVGFAGGPERISGRIKIYDLDAGFTNPKQLGQSVITHTFINLYPFIGKRLIIKPYSFDIHAGLEAGIPITAREKTKVTSGNKTLVAERDRRKLLDLRPRIQFRLQRNRYGIAAGFALGTTDYAEAAFNNTFSAIIRLGMYYRLK